MRPIDRWDGELTTGETNELLIRLAQVHSSLIREEAIRKYIPSINTDTIPACCDIPPPYTCASYIACLDDTPGKRYSLAQDIYHLSQIKAFFSKRADLDFGYDKQGDAVEKFMESELSCKSVNEAFRAWEGGRFIFDHRAEAVLHGAQRKISEVLGECPTFADIAGSFGPGATTQLPKRMACAKVKLSQPLACSRDMSRVLSQALETLPHFLGTAQDSLEQVTATVEIHHGKLVTVPKTYKIDRTVMIEPWLNGFFQLGVGRIITDRLRAVGVDLRDQEKNKSLARANSISGALATLDLSSASDSISVGLVRHLLPPDWYDLLSALRTSSCEYNGKVFTLEKFSSMGNGYTFPLESLLFWAIVSSVPGNLNRTFVYGDDILSPCGTVRETMRMLRVLGFEVNPDKSFYTGIFRESCGGDYFFGFDVRPLYIKDRMSGHDLFRLHNYYVRRGLLDLARIVLEYIGTELAIYGPDGYGDGHLIIDEVLCYPGSQDPFYRHRKARRNGWGGHLFDTFTYAKRKFKRRVWGDRVLPLYSIYLKEVSGLDDDSIHFSEQRLFTKDGTPVDFLPGVKGYKRISIYTLA